MSGFWKAPRALADFLSEGRLTLTAYALLHYLGESRSDRPQGLTTTNAALAGVLEVHERTIRRSLVALRTAGLIDFEEHERRAAFTIRTTAALRALESADTCPQGVRSVSADAENAADSVRSSTSCDPASDQGTDGTPSADTSEASGALETGDRRQELGPPPTAVAHRDPSEVVDLVPTSGAQDLVARYVDLVRELGEPAPKRLVGQVARQVGELLRDGVSPTTLARALELLVEKRLNPATLPSLVPEAAAGPRRDRDHPADRMLRDLRGGLR